MQNIVIYIATVRPLLSLKFGLWFQQSSGIYVQSIAIYMAVVIPLSFYKSGLLYHYFGGTI